MALFENYERRIGQITPVLEKYGFKDLEDARDYCLSKGIDCENIVHGIQPIAFDNAVWATGADRCTACGRLCARVGVGGVCAGARVAGAERRAGRAGGTGGLRNAKWRGVTRHSARWRRGG